MQILAVGYTPPPPPPRTTLSFSFQDLVSRLLH